MAIVVDDRQQRSSPRIQELLLKNLTLRHVKVERLEFADYAFEGQPINGVVPTVGIEYCSLSDFLGKITSERLSFQLAGMLKSYNVPILMVSGMIEEDRQTHKVKTYGYNATHSYAAVLGILFSAQMHGVKFVNCADQDACGLEIVRRYRYFQEDPSAHQFFREHIVELGNDVSDELLRMPIGGAIDRAVKALMALSRDIGETRALAALKHYGSLDILTHCTVEQLQKIDGWGPTVAKGFYDAVRKMYD